MRKKVRKLIITFASTTMAMKMEKEAKKRQLPGRIIPVPREITAGCGLAYCVDPSEKAILEQMMKETEIIPEQMVELMIAA